MGRCAGIAPLAAVLAALSMRAEASPPPSKAPPPESPPAQAPPAQVPQGHAPPAKPGDGPTKPADRPKSLDELLGTGGARTADATRPPTTTPPEGDGATTDPVEQKRQEQLKRALTEKEAADAFVAAVAQMARSARSLQDDRDPGLATQRIQEDVLAKLDLLLKQPPKKGKSGSSSSSQQQQQAQAQPKNAPPKQSASGSKSRKDRANQPASDSSPDAPAPPSEQTALEQALESAGAEWGNLPPRLREMIRQGLREQPSGLYQRLTEEYYKRLAEEASK
ncbi:MAG: hypothetical protein U0575_06055 [Phycisphaerales bacterium]